MKKLILLLKMIVVFKKILSKGMGRMHRKQARQEVRASLKSRETCMLVKECHEASEISFPIRHKEKFMGLFWVEEW